MRMVKEGFVGKHGDGKGPGLWDYANGDRMPWNDLRRLSAMDVPWAGETICGVTLVHGWLKEWVACAGVDMLAETAMESSVWDVLGKVDRMWPGAVTREDMARMQPSIEYWAGRILQMADRNPGKVLQQQVLRVTRWWTPTHPSMRDAGLAQTETEN